MKEILCIIKNPINSNRLYTFYKDSTYRLDSWPLDTYAQWKVENDKFMIMHNNEKTWLNASGEEELFNALKLEIAILKLLVE